MLTYADLKEKLAGFLAATGLTFEEFDPILPVFRRRYRELFTPGLTRKGTLRKRKEGGGELWTCERCKKRVCFEKSSADKPELCDECWNQVENLGAIWSKG